MLPFRALAPEDAGWLEALHAESFEAPRRWPANVIAAFLKSPAAYGCAFVKKDSPAAFLLGQSAADEAEIVTLVTLPAFRRQNIATQLVEEFCRDARENGKTRLFLEVAENNTPAIALYRKLGFEKAGVRVNYYPQDGYGVDAWIMRKYL